MKGANHSKLVSTQVTAKWPISTTSTKSSRQSNVNSQTACSREM